MSSWARSTTSSRSGRPKFFIDGVDDQKAQVRESFKTIREEANEKGFTVDVWTLCIAIDNCGAPGVGVRFARGTGYSWMSKNDANVLPDGSFSYRGPALGEKFTGAKRRARGTETNPHRDDDHVRNVHEFSRCQGIGKHRDLPRGALHCAVHPTRPGMNASVSGERDSTAKGSITHTGFRNLLGCSPPSADRVGILRSRRGGRGRCGRADRARGCRARRPRATRSGRRGRPRRGSREPARPWRARTRW
jgi:hypothetical protein